MIGTALLIIAVIVATWIVGILIYDRKFVKSVLGTNRITRRIVSWGELVLPPMRRVTLATQGFLRDAYTRNAPDGFNFWHIVLVAAPAAICAIALNAEYGFTAYTFAGFFNEAPGTEATIFNYALSSLFAWLMLAVVALLGLIRFDNLGAQPLGDPADHTYREKIIFNHRLKMFAINVILVIAVLQAWNGYQRGDEFILAANNQEQIAGNVATTDVTNNLAVSLTNAFLGFLLPWISALTFRYLMTFGLWALAGVIATILFLLLWLPTWVFNGRVVRYQQQHGLPPGVLNETETPQQTQAEQQEAPRNPPPQEPAPNNRQEQPFNERRAEEREELNERRDAERRHREQANSNPFGTDTY